MRVVSLNEYTDAQLRRLCARIGLASRVDEVCSVVTDLLGPAGTRALTDPPLWRSDVADDHTPLEYSVAFEQDGSATLRLLVECVARKPNPRSNLRAGLAALNRLAERYPLSTDRLEAVRDLFLPDDPRGLFSLWFSIVVTAADLRVKVYLNPEVRGAHRAPGLVSEGLHRLGLGEGFRTLTEHTARPGSTLDRFSFFALDLDDTPRSRVKVYQSHDRCSVRDLRRSAAACGDADDTQLTEFGALVGGLDCYEGRPLVSSHTFLGGQAEPSGFSLYLPVRDYVRDDAVALARTRALLVRHGLDHTALDRVVDAVRDRPLESGPGLIAHVSLRMGRPRPGVTVYLSAEAYGGTADAGARVGAA
ncbi:tryptophan dimethylallyltransferase family protein [Actinokineospora sp. NBRC 105648]|uniref:tryptophan dimethylallyltransferase family protein n=1 Tax=Actinokineospora sp. NBRC 105648 TaxID=3032206 RepID=UPI0024A056DE|nr:tryptophan dimethylallyltransferase family protein [Actinokineospora sp. NBRC 105648]GLZ38824.1 prenyltransferase [Actinokineospora sp. NBRC 105648]